MAGRPLVAWLPHLGLRPRGRLPDDAALAETLPGPRPLPEIREELEQTLAQVREAVQRRIGLRLPQKQSAAKCTSHGTLDAGEFVAERPLIDSESGIQLPALWLQPKPGNDRGPVVLHVAEEGKPGDTTQPSLALALVRARHRELSLDVRGAGETHPRDRKNLRPLTRYDAA